MHRLLPFLLSLFLAWQCWLAPPAMALTEPVLQPHQEQQLIQIQTRLETVADLQQRGVLAADVAQTQQSYYLSQARSITQSDLSAAQLAELVAIYQQRPLRHTPGPWQRLQGFFTFLNLIWFLASGLLVIALAWLVGLYLIPLLLLIPAAVYEVGFYLVCLGVIVAARLAPASLAEWVALPGCLGYLGAIGFTHYQHEEALKQFYSRSRIDPLVVNSLIVCLLWATVAVIYQSTTIGFLAVIALESCLGFSVMVFPLTYFIGFKGWGAAMRATFVSLLLLLTYLTVRLGQLQLPYFELFAPGLLFMGAFVYFIGLLILSSKTNWGSPAGFYLGMQAVTIVSGIGALWIGSVWAIPTLRGIGGTFFALYLVEKYFELPWSQKSFAWAALGLALLLYGIALTARQYPEYFLLISG